MDFPVTEVKLPASELSRLPIKILLYYWKQKKGRALFTMVLVGGILSLWRVGSLRQRYQETLISQHLDPRNRITKVDWKFLRQLKKLRKTCVPKFFCSETFHFILLTVLLLCRTYLSITIAEVVSSNAQALADRQLYKFIFGLSQLGIMAIPTALMNSALKYFTSTLSAYIRRRLTLFCHEYYIDSNNTFYKSIHLLPNDNLGERITQDIDKFSNSVSDFYANSFKTLVDIFFLSRYLSKTIGWKGPIIMFAYFVSTGVFLRSFMPSFSKLFTAQQRMEETFRLSHAKILNRAEEISFYRASEREKENLNTNFMQMFYSTFNILRLRAIVNAMDGWLTKYGATIVGYALCAIPIFSNRNVKETTSDRVKEFILNIQLLIHLSSAMGQVVGLYRKLLNLSQTTNKVDQLIQILQTLHRVVVSKSSPAVSNEKNNEKKEIEKSKKKKSEKQSSDINDDNNEAEKEQTIHKTSGDDQTKEESDSSESESESDSDSESDDDDEKNFGDFIRFKDVTAIIRNDRILFKNLTFTVKPGSNLLISGPPGCGKTTILRLLSGLIPVYSGNIIKPFGGLKEIYFLPQKPYFFFGSLRDQIIYPQTQKDMISSGKDDNLIFQILDQLQLSYLPRNNSLDCSGNWDQMLSDVEKQILSVGRLFYHKPRFGVIDECLYLLSVDAEEKIYKTLADMSITMISVSNRKSLRQFHENLLIFDNNGNWDLSSLHQADRFSFSPSTNSPSFRKNLTKLSS